jgi:MFS family permease
MTKMPIGNCPVGKGVDAARCTRFVVLLGIVSLFADMTYESARSITGPFLALLGASATAVGIVAGFGELLGYALRFVSGRIADRTGRYWAVTLFGYALNLLAVPALALAGNWQTAIEGMSPQKGER